MTDPRAYVRNWTSFHSAGLPLLLVAMVTLSSISTIRGNSPQLVPANIEEPTFPTSPFYNPGPCASCTTSFQYIANGHSGIQTQSAPIGSCGGVCNGLFQVSAGTMYDPIGMLAEGVAYSDCIGLVCGINLATWSLKLPSGLPDSCVPSLPLTSGATASSCVDVRGFDLSGTVAGALGGILLTSATPVGDPTCTQFLGTTPDKGDIPANACWTTDYQIVQAGQAINPPCIQGATACITSSSITSKSNTTVVDPIVNGKQYNGTFVQLGTQVSQQTWYVYREITSLTLQIVPPAIVPLCVKTNTGSANVCNGNVSVCGFFAIAKCDPMRTLTSSLPGLVSDINKVSILTSTRISFGLNTVGFGGLTCSQSDVVSGNCWYGIVGVWIGGQGIQTSGCTGQNTCNFVQGIHTQLPIFQDPGLIRPATVPTVDRLVNLSQLSNKTMPEIIAANTYGQVFTYIDTQSLGVQYSANTASCTISTLTSCITTPVPVVINVPLIYDIIGSKSLANWLYQYPGIPPNGGTTAGFISGRVVDGSSKNILGQYRPIIGACISLSAPCSGQPGQIELQTDTNGYYTLSNIPPGTYTLYASAHGYSTVFQTNVVTSVGHTTVVNFVLQPVNPPGVSCLIQPTPNPIPFQGPIPGIACMPNWVWYTLGAAVFGIIVVAVLAWSPFGGALVSGAGRGLRSLTNRGGNGRARHRGYAVPTTFTGKYR